MLVVKVEIWPGGDSESAQLLGTVALANVSALQENSHYVAIAADDTGAETEFGLVNHQRSAGFWSLAAAAAAAAHERTGRPAAPEATVVNLADIPGVDADEVTDTADALWEVTDRGEQIFRAAMVRLRRAGAALAPW